MKGYLVSMNLTYYQDPESDDLSFLDDFQHSNNIANILEYTLLNMKCYFFSLSKYKFKHLKHLEFVVSLHLLLFMNSS